jgi:hypothetical protein
MKYDILQSLAPKIHREMVSKFYDDVFSHAFPVLSNPNLKLKVANYLSFAIADFESRAPSNSRVWFYPLVNASKFDLAATLNILTSVVSKNPKVAGIITQLVGEEIRPTSPYPAHLLSLLFTCQIYRGKDSDTGRMITKDLAADCVSHHDSNVRILAQKCLFLTESEFFDFDSYPYLKTFLKYTLYETEPDRRAAL